MKVTFRDQYGSLQFVGPHPMVSNQGKKPTKNDVRRNKKIARKWKMTDARYASGVTSSKFVYFAEFTFVNSAGHQRQIVVTDYEKF